MPSDKMASLHRQSEFGQEYRIIDNEEVSLPLTIHQPDPRSFGRTKILQLLGWIFELQPDCDLSKRSRENNVYMSLWHVCLQMNAIWTM